MVIVILFLGAVAVTVAYNWVSRENEQSQSIAGVASVSGIAPVAHSLEFEEYEEDEEDSYVEEYKLEDNHEEPTQHEYGEMEPFPTHHELQPGEDHIHDEIYYGIDRGLGIVEPYYNEPGGYYEPEDSYYDSRDHDIPDYGNYGEHY